MKSSKELKKLGYKNLKKHYLTYFLSCFIAALFGVEFYYTLTLFNMEIDLDRVKNSIDGTRGVFAILLKGSLSNTIANAIGSVIHSKDIVSVILIILSVIGTFIMWVFVKNIFRVILRRINLEGRTYKKITFQTYMFLLNCKKWIKASITMLITSILYFFWSFTIIGLVIKRYSYFLVPFIVAENPDIDSIKAITLSRKMMYGHKTDAFIMELSFIIWELLGFITLGMSKLLFSNIYKMSTYSEFYVEVRNISKKYKVENIELLNDEYLYKYASSEVLNKEYSDITNLIERQNASKEEKTNIYYKILDFFGIKTKNDKNKEISLLKNKVVYIKLVLNNKAYPNRLSPIPQKRELYKFEVNNYMRKYSIWSIILLFFIFSFIGWAWEVGYHIIKTGYFVNRGVLHGPILPIYGSGAVLMIMLLYKFRDKPLLEFISMILICGLVEYFTSYYLEMKFDGTKWWDYSNYVLNLNGRISAEGLLFFGLGGMVGVYFAAPILDNLITKIYKPVLVIICSVLLSIYVVDKIYSSVYPNEGKGISKPNKMVINKRFN